MSRCDKFTHLTNQRGAAMLEMAIAVPIFLGLLLAIVDFGTYFNARSVLLSAAYNCAKAAATYSCSPTSFTTIIQDGVTPIISSAAVTINANLALGSAPTRHYKVTLGYNGAPLSVFTSTLGMYPLSATGVAHCP